MTHRSLIRRRHHEQDLTRRGGAKHAVLGALLALCSLEAAAEAAEGDVPSFQCCAAPAVDSLVGAYLDVTARLATTPSADASAQLDALARKAQSEAPTPEDRVAFQQVVTAARALASGGVAEQHARVDELTRPVLWLALRHEGGGRTLVEAWCPGLGSWLQTDTRAVHDPFGRGCGTFR